MQRWEEKGVDPDVFYNSMILAKNCTKDTKLISNHFKIIHNVYPTGEKLFTWRIEESDKCYLCSETDTIIHAIATCDNTREFISQVMEDLDFEQNYTNGICVQDFIFGVENTAWNFIFILLKWYISYRRCQKLPLIKNSFMNTLYIHVITEKKYSPENIFYDKWDRIPCILLKAREFEMKFNI